MNENDKTALQIYSGGMSSLVTISAAGLATATALMQLGGSSNDGHGWYLAAMATFFIALILCFLAMAGLTGQAVAAKPDVYVANVNLPALFAFILMCAGFALLGYGAFSSASRSHGEDSREIIKKLELCRSAGGQTAEARLKCYDALVDVQVIGSGVTAEDIARLPEKDRVWINLMVRGIGGQDRGH